MVEIFWKIKDFNHSKTKIRLVLLKRQPYLGLYSPHFLNTMNGTQQGFWTYSVAKTPQTNNRDKRCPYQARATFLSTITGTPVKPTPNLNQAQQAQPSLLPVLSKKRSASQKLAFSLPMYFLRHCLFVFPSRFLSS